MKWRVFSWLPGWRTGLRLAVLATLLVSGPAGAQSTSATARVLFREARKLMDQGHFEEACPKLEESLRLDHGIGTQFNLAHCWEKTGRTASAWGLFLDVASAASGAGQAKRETAARQRASALEAQLMNLVIEVRQPLPDLAIHRGGELVGRGAWGTPMPVDPGTYRIEASAPGRRPWSKEVVVQVPGETVSVSVPALEREYEEIASAGASGDPAPIGKAGGSPDHDEGQGMSTGRIVTGSLFAAVGVAGVVTGIVYGLKSQSETAKAEELCVGGPSGTVCDRDSDLPNFDGGVQERSELEEHRDNASQAQTIGYIGWGVGVAGLAASTIVFLTAPSGDAGSDSARLRLTPGFRAGLLGTTLSGSF